MVDERELAEQCRGELARITRIALQDDQEHQIFQRELLHGELAVKSHLTQAQEKSAYQPASAHHPIESQVGRRGY